MAKEGCTALREPPGDRRTKRLTMSFPIIVRGASEGQQFEEATQTFVICEHGCLVAMKTPLVKGQLIRITNTKTKGEMACAVVFLGQVTAEGKTETGIEFQESSPRFWQVTFPPDDWNPRDRKRPPVYSGSPLGRNPVPAK